MATTASLSAPLEIERLFAWPKNFHRLISRLERYATNFLAMVQLGCTLILRHLSDYF
jgi:transposase